MKLQKIDNSHDPGHDEYFFHCPGCNMGHTFVTSWGIRALQNRVGRGHFGTPPTWKFNGDMVKPTFQPSLLYTFSDGVEPAQRICHLFMTDGKICYLADSTHQYSGKSIEMAGI